MSDTDHGDQDSNKKVTSSLNQLNTTDNLTLSSFTPLGTVQDNVINVLFFVSDFVNICSSFHLYPDIFQDWKVTTKKEKNTKKLM